jgi:hypothetical protein
MRTIQHPGVEVREYDLSQTAPAIAGTTCLVMGFSQTGEEKEPYEFTSKNSFISYFGKPTNEAEYYFYAGAMEVLQQQGHLLAARLPYKADSYNKKFRAMTYSLTSHGELEDITPSAMYTELSTLGVTGFNAIKLTAAASSIDSDTVDKYRTGTSPTQDTMVIIDKGKTVKTQTTMGIEVGGIFPVVVTPFNAIGSQGIWLPSSTSALTVSTNPYSGWYPLSSLYANETQTIDDMGVEYSLDLVDSFSKNSVSKQLIDMFPAIDYNADGKLNPYNLHNIAIVVCKTFEDINNDNKIGVKFLETFSGSLNPAAVDQSTGESIFLDDIVNNNSNYIELYSNATSGVLPNNKSMWSNYICDTQTEFAKNGVSMLIGFDTSAFTSSIVGSSIAPNMADVFDKLSNIDETSIDIIMDAGLSTIANATSGTLSGSYTPATTPTTAPSSRDSLGTWRNVCNEILDMCKFVRKDCIGVIDGPRNLVLRGNEKIERPSTTDLIDTTVLPQMKYISGLNSSYGTGNIMWNAVINDFTGKKIWLPPSIKATGVMIYTDVTANYWDAPAGLNRGVLYGVNDIAFNPKPKQMDAIYTKAWNYARMYPLDGIVLEGQKTLQVKPSAFDRVNVRRLFLRLERLAYQVLRRFVYEPNNYFTRTQILDILTPVFESVKVRGGLYDYKIICDESNNTPEVIDRNELKIAIALKATRTAEFVLCDFYALRTGASFNEIIL